MSLYEGAKALTLDACGRAIPLPHEVHVNYGSDVAMFQRPPGAKLLVVQGEVGGPWKLGAGDQRARTFTAASASDIATATSHGYTHGVEGPLKVANSGGALPAGLNSSSSYWLGVRDIHTWKFYGSESNALAAVSAIDLTDNGTGTHSIFGPAVSVTVAAADITNGLYAWPIPAASSAMMDRVYAAPDRVTVVGTGASDVLVLGWA